MSGIHRYNIMDTHVLCLCIYIYIYLHMYQDMYIYICSHRFTKLRCMVAYIYTNTYALTYDVSVSMNT